MEGVAASVRTAAPGRCGAAICAGRIETGTERRVWIWIWIVRREGEGKGWGKDSVVGVAWRNPPRREMRGRG
jgi:hypothetical protein